MNTQILPTEELLKENAFLKEQVASLNEQLAWLKRQIFGQRSEKFLDKNSDQLLLNGFEKPPLPESEKKTVTYQRGKPKRDGQDKITLPDDLPVERQVIDLSEQEKVCPETGKTLVKIGEEITRKIAMKPGSYFIKEIVRPKYAFPGNVDAGIHTALLPDSLLNRCQADESFLADILVKKFADHLPIYRQVDILAREGIHISRQTINQWVFRCGEALKPLYDEMFSYILKSNNVFIDETPLDMLKPGNGKVHQAFMWVMAGGNTSDPPYRIYKFSTNRCHYNAADLLKNYYGVLHSDKYGAYEALANKKQLIWCPCWAHIRRKFIEAENGDLLFRNWVLRKIKYLFMLERVAWKRSEEERLRIRQQKEQPIIDELIAAIKEKLVNGKILPKSKFKEALGYFTSLIPYVKNYINHAWSRLDNNVAERAVRPLAIGRKNWLFVGNEIGGETAAIILSLVQTCRAIGINPREYIEDIMRRIMSHNSQKLHELLPHHWAESRNKI